MKKAGLEEVVLLYVIDADSFQTEVDGGVALNLDQVRQTAMSKLDCPGRISSVRRNRGKVGDFPRVARGGNSQRPRTNKMYSLIVAGRQKRDILGELFVGSTTDRIIRKSKAPVLVAKYQHPPRS